MKKIYSLALAYIFAGALSAQNSFWTPTTYKGAFPVSDGTPATDWTNGWTNWDPENTAYNLIINDSTKTVAQIAWANGFPALNATPDYRLLNSSSAAATGASFSHSKLSGSFWTPTTYKGAFPVSDGTSATDWTSGWTNWDPENTNYAVPTFTVNADITANTTWTAGTVVNLQNKVYVKNNASLTIEPGVIVRGDKATQGTLVITRGAKIIAAGTSSNPIVFTSGEAAGARAEGDWGGLVILGKAKNNQPGGVANVEGLAVSTDSEFGGTDDTDSSGVLNYVRVEFSGIPLQPNKETNGITFGSIGSKTSVHHVQVSFGGDDGFEWFGGTVDAKYLVSFRCLDDDFDADFGWRGRVQFGLIVRDKDLSDAAGDSNGWETDNDATGSGALPRTQAVFSNITNIGPLRNGTQTLPVGEKFERAVYIRRNSALSIFNSIHASWEKGLYVKDAGTVDNFTTNDSAVFAYNIIASDIDQTIVGDANATQSFYNSIFSSPEITVNSDITTNTTWTAGSVIDLQNKVYVKNNAVLTIEPGVIVRGDKATQGTLIITRGAKIIAKGTSTDPIIFTSGEPAGSRAEGDWGGLVILGKAKNNQPGGVANVEGLAVSSDTEFGGTDDTDSSGVLNYVRVEFSGIALQPNKETNGITFGSIGSKTSVHHVQVSFSGDDGFEWFGGTVDAKYLVSFRNLDDDFDADFGWRGRVQFGLIVRDKDLSDAAGDSNGFETDNDATGSGATPRTAAVFSNITNIGPLRNGTVTLPGGEKFDRAYYIRRNSALSIFNSIATSWEKGLYIKDAGTVDNFTTNDSAVFANNLILSDIDQAIVGDVNALLSFYSAIFMNDNNDSTKTVADVAWVNAFPASLNSTPDYRLGASSVAATGANFDHVKFGVNVGVREVEVENISNLSLYPNPLNGMATINFNLAKGGNVNLNVYDHTGKLVKNLVNANTAPGFHSIQIDASELPEGVYFAVISMPEVTRSVKMVIIR